MQLYQFAKDKGASTIAADKLDQNFKRLRPLQADGTARQYAITETPEGWALEIFLEELVDQQMPQILIPEPPESGTHILGATNGSFVWLATESCE